MTMDLHTKKKDRKKEKKIKSQKWSLQKKCIILSKNKKTNSSTVLPILFESRKQGW